MSGRPRHRHLDEDSVRTRPGRAKSRPRSKDRPAHEHAIRGTVLTVDRGRFTVLPEGAAEPVWAVKARELGRKGVAVGDHVGLVGEVKADALSRIVRVEPRTTVLRRTADDTDPVERVIVANADQLAIVTAVVNPEPRPRLIDRALVAAYDAGLEPLLIVTKTDLARPDELLAMYDTFGLRVITIDRSSDIGPVRAALHDRITVLLGHSGVGKSTLVNRLVPAADRATGAVNAVTGRGRHTSTSAYALPLHDGGWIIDTPGIRSFGLAHIDPGRVMHAFPDLEGGTVECPRSCSHDEAECGLDAFASTADAVARLDSLRRLLRSRTEE